MAVIKVLKDEQLVNGNNKEDVYPVTSTQAVFSQNSSGVTSLLLEDRLINHESDALELHRQTEKLTVAHTNDKSSTIFEITGVPLVMSLTGSATIDTYGDAESVTIDPNNLTGKQFTVNSSASGVTPEHPQGSKNGTNWVATFTIPNETWLILTPGIYSSSFAATYNGVSKSNSKDINVTLRRFYSYAESAPTDTASLEAFRLTGVSDYNTSMEYTFTIPAISQGEKHIYFAVPSPMVITQVIQPSVGPTSPFAFHTKGTVNRVINGIPYTYNLYESGTTASSADGLEDTSYPKELKVIIRNQ